MLSDKLKRYRKREKISQEALSKISNVTYSTIIKIESGVNKNPTIQTIQKIAKALGVTIDELLR